MRYMLIRVSDGKALAYGPTEQSLHGMRANMRDETVIRPHTPTPVDRDARYLRRLQASYIANRDCPRK
jgi:hypothetical protein